MSTKTLLLIPPKYELSYPPLGTPALLAFLKLRGHVASQMDINYEYARYFMNRVSLDSSEVDSPLVRHVTWKRLSNQIFISKAKSTVYYAEELKNPFSEAAYDDWTDSSFYFAENLLDSKNLEKFLEDDQENTYLQFYKESNLASKILEGEYDFLGISIISPSQIIPTLTLAKYLKENFEEVPKIVLGGQWCTLFAKEFVKRDDFTKWIDFFIRGEGETPLLKLVEEFEGNRNFIEIPNLSFAREGRWITGINSSKEDMSELPTPDFEGLLENEYFNFTQKGKVGITYESSRECYWNRCTYCVDLPLPHEGYRIKPVKQVISEIKEIQEKYNPDYLIFSDPAIAPSRLKFISEAMVREGIRIPFWCFGRIEGNFTKAIFEIAKKAGCDEIDFGMETASQRLMDFVDKGTNTQEVSRVIRDCSEAGINTSLQVIFRFPTETYDEGMETVQFLADHKKWIHEISTNIYYLTPGNHMFNDPKRFQIRIPEGQPPFRFFYEFENLTQDTITYEEAHQLNDVYRMLTGEGVNRVEVRKGWLEKSEIKNVTESAKPYLDEIKEVFEASLELCGNRTKTYLFLLEDGTPVGFMSEGEAAQLKEYLKVNLTR